jgi:hypothetical protein
MNISGGSDTVDYQWAAAARQWLKVWGELHYTAATESYTVIWGRDHAGNFVSPTMTVAGVAGDATNLSTGTATLNFASHLTGGPAAGETVALASYYVTRCPNVP